MENIQFNEAMDILTDYYGIPQWESNPKKGQNRHEIMRVWCEELGKYTVDQIREACYWLTRTKKTMTFPVLASVLNELRNARKENDEKLKEESERERTIALANGIGQKYGRESRKHFLEQCGIYDATDLPKHLYPEEKHIMTLVEEEVLNKKNLEMFKFLKNRGYTGLLHLRSAGRDVYDKTLLEFKEYYKEYFDETEKNSFTIKEG